MSDGAANFVRRLFVILNGVFWLILFGFCLWVILFNVWVFFGCPGFFEDIPASECENLGNRKIIGVYQFVGCLVVAGIISDSILKSEMRHAIPNYGNTFSSGPRNTD